MSLRVHEIAEGTHRILNPLAEARFMLLGELCQLTPALRLLELACGNAEMISRGSQHWWAST